MVKVKICGITNLEDGRAAVNAGADMLGFNFYRPSPRFIEPEIARQIIQTLKTDHEFTSVGIFVDESLDKLLRIVSAAGVDAVQLHGDESPAYCRDLKARLNGQTIIKALRAIESFAPEDATNYTVDAVMLDAVHGALFGGTGRTADWKLARDVRKLVRCFFLSGGLSPENVAAAISEVDPYAVDACSLLESSPGKKDPVRVRAFVGAARQQLE